eukprot:707004-Prymnesium_polylepis.1
MKKAQSLVFSTDLRARRARDGTARLSRAQGRRGGGRAAVQQRRRKGSRAQRWGVAAARGPIAGGVHGGAEGLGPEEDAGLVEPVDHARVVRVVRAAHQ